MINTNLSLSKNSLYVCPRTNSATSHLARRCTREAEVTLRRLSGPSGSSRLPTLGATHALDRVACRRKQTDQVLALDLTAQDLTQEAGLFREAPLKDRARLPSVLTRDWLGHYEGRKWRGPSPRNDVHYRLRISSRRARPFPPAEGRIRRDSRELEIPKICEGEKPPVCPERHNSISIVTLRNELIGKLVSRLPRCRCCQRTRGEKQLSDDELIE